MYHDGNIIVLYKNGIFISTDNGNNWTERLTITIRIQQFRFASTIVVGPNGSYFFWD